MEPGLQFVDVLHLADCGLDRTGLVRTGLVRTELVRAELDRTGLDGTGLTLFTGMFGVARWLLAGG